MIIDIKGNTVTDVHKICISNYKKDIFLTKLPDVRWTDNFNLACCFDSELEAVEFSENEDVQKIIGDELELFIWTDTKQSIFEI